MNQGDQMPPTQDNSEELRSDKLSAEKQRIEKEYERKLYVIKHKEKIAKYVKIIGWSILGLLLIIALVILALKVVDIFTTEEVIAPVEVKEDLPPQDFLIETEKITLLQPIKGETNYDVLVQLKNNNSEWGVSKLKYTILLKDKFDKVVGMSERNSYILPGQEKSLIEIGINADRIAQKSEVQIEMLEVKKLTQGANINIVVDDSKYVVDGNNSRVEAHLFNSSPFTLDKIDVGIVLFDANGEVIGLNYTNFSPFVTKTRRFIVVNWPQQVFEGVDRVYIEPNVDVFQSSSFLNVYGTGQTLEF